MDFVTNNEIEWKNFGAISDKIIFPEETYIIPDHRKKWINNLKRLFPDDSKKIDHYVNYIYKVKNYFKFYALMKTFPKCLQKPAQYILHKFKRNWMLVST